MKSQSHNNVTAMWSLCDHKNWQAQRSLKGLRKVLLTWPQCLRSQNQIDHMYKRLDVTDLVTQRFLWSPRGRKVVYFHRRLVPAYLWLISDETTTIAQRFISDQSLIGCKVVSKRAPFIRRWVHNMSLTCLHITAPILPQVFTEFTSAIQYWF